MTKIPVQKQSANTGSKIRWDFLVLKSLMEKKFPGLISKELLSLIKQGVKIRKEFPALVNIAYPFDVKSERALET